MTLTLLLLVALPAASGQGDRLSWAVETVDDGDFTGLYTSIAVDDTGRSHITYLDQGSDAIKYATESDEGWAIQVLDSSGGFTGNTNIALDDAGLPHVTFFSGITRLVKYAAWNGSSWHLREVELGHFEGYNRMAIDSAGKIHIVYTYINGRIRHATWDGTEWSFETVDVEGVTAKYLSLAIDSEDRLHMAYYDLGNLRYVFWDGATWRMEIVDASERAGWFASLALDSQDLPHIAYRDTVAKKLRYARKTTSSWYLDTADPNGDTGWDTYLGVDGQDRVHIVYYERLQAELRHALRKQNSWLVEEVDSGGVVGWYASLALDNKGRPHISYYDWSHGSLKYATGVAHLAVRTLAPRDVTSTEAVLRGELISLGNLPQAKVSFEWRFKEAGDWQSTPSELRSSEGTWEVTISSLTPEEEYEFRAKVEAPGEVVLGETMDFRTLPPAMDEVTPPFFTEPLFLVIGLLGLLLGWAVFVLFTGRRKKRPET